MISPTGGGIRNDSGGSGNWLVKREIYKPKRKTYLHEGIDYDLVGDKGQIVISPGTGIIERVAYPYPDTKEFGGCVIRMDGVWIKMFYFRLYDSLIKQRVAMGQPIGIGQDIGERYKGVSPHIHLEVIVEAIKDKKIVKVKINPEILMDG